MKARAFALLFALCAPREARADEPMTCESAFETADMRLRPSESRLLDARDALRACSLPTCKPWMVDDCSKRLAEVEGRIPSIALSAVDAQGAPLDDVRVVEGEREIAAHLNGVAVEIDPGPHLLVAERAGTKVERSIVVVEGKKAQQVVFMFQSTAPAPPIEVRPPPSAPKSEYAYPWARPFAAGLLASGIAAVGTGAILGIVAIGKKDDAHCDASHLCEGEPLSDARSTARASTVAFGLGGALAVASVVTFFVFGNERVQATASLGRVGVVGRF